MKHLYLSILLVALAGVCYSQPKMQATIKPGSTPRTVDIYLKSSASFDQRDEAMTFALAIPATVTNGPTLGSSGVTANSTGPVTSIAGLQPSFLVNKLSTTQREVFVSSEAINGVTCYIYTFIFAGTAPAVHRWVKDEEQLIFSIQFNGCSSNCVPEVQQLVNLSNGGNFGISYWYFQPNTLGDITNYEAPFYANSKSGTPVNGSSNDGSVLSTVRLTTSVSFGRELKQSLHVSAPTNTGADFSSAETAVNSKIPAAGKPDFQVYSNPVSNGVANLQFINQPKGSYTVKLSNSLGQVVLTRQIVHNAGSSNYQIELSNVAKGYYILDVTGADNNRKAIKIIY